MEELWYKIKRLLSQFTHFQKRNRIKRYGFPVLLVVGVFLVKQFFHPLLGDNSAFIMVSFIVAVSSWYGGLGPGIFATLISSLVVYFAFLSADIDDHPFIGDILLTGIFLAEGLIISIASEARHEMEDQKDEFIGFVAHELKNPLAAINGFAGLIVNNAKRNGNEKMASYGESINNSSSRMLELINDLLDITKIEIGNFSYTHSFFNISDLAKEVVSHQQIISKNRSIELKGSSGGMLYGDRYRIGQVITNLLTNAIKYSPENKKVRVSITETKNSISLNVRDYGLGIAKKDQQKIFSRFYRTDKVQRSKSQGTGLGLFICDQIVRHHEGKIWVKSKEGKGSTFFLELPVRITQQAPVTNLH